MRDACRPEVMSRGLGKIERAILDDITIGGPSSVLIHSWGLLCHHNCFRRPAFWNFEPTTAERKAVTRAMRSFVRKFPQYALTGGKERKMLYLYEPADPISAMWAKLSSSARSSSRGRKRWQPCRLTAGPLCQLISVRSFTPRACV